ncbi:MAG: SelB C-terminal domain-containing protein, partial [Peptococcaceae bacterium]|nr:SelB C-terminal domain-containing protein [Peptococcaceae bacterium]
QAAPVPLSALSQSAQLPEKETSAAAAALSEAGRIKYLMIDGERQYYSAAPDKNWRDHMAGLLNDYHRKYPLRQGMPAAELRQRVFAKFNAKQFSALLEGYAADGLVAPPGPLAAKADFVCAPAPKQKADLDAIETVYREGGFTPPDWADVVNTMRISAVDAAEYLTWLLEHDRLIRAGEMIFASGAVREAEELLRSKFTVFTVAEARDALNSSRKYVLALLGFFDARKYTAREGDSRRFLKL